MPGDSQFQSKVLPILQKYCYECHGEGANEGDLTLDQYTNYAKLVGDRTVWDRVRQQVSCYVMPPGDAIAPTAEQRTEILRWIDDSVFYCDPERPDPGHVTLRRMNSTEYNNTVRDVFFARIRPANSFPLDDTGFGFDNIGDVLSISPVLMEKYVRAAQQVMEESIRIEPPKMVNVQHLHGKPSQKLSVQGDVNRDNPVLSSQDASVGFEVDIPQLAIYRISVRSAVTQVGDERTRLEIRVDDVAVGNMEPVEEWEARWQEWKSNKLFVELSEGVHRLTVRVANPLGIADKGVEVKRSAAIGMLALEGPFAPTLGSPSPFLRWLTSSQSLGQPSLTLSGEDFEAGSGRQGSDTGSIWLASNGFCSVVVKIPQAGQYRIHVKAGAQQVGHELVRFEVKCDEAELGEFEVTTKEQAAEWIEFDANLSAGDHKLQVGFTNEFRDPDTAEERWLWFHEMKLVGPRETDLGPTATQLPSLLRRAGRMIFRRPLSGKEHAKLLSLANQALDAGEPSLGALRLALETMLISPTFLFHAMPRAGGQASGVSLPIDEFTLAERLSFFLWSTTPDDELLELAEQGHLRRELDQQLRRMLAHPNSRALTKNFAGQWLQLRDIDLVTPNRRRFDTFSQQLASDMKRESELFFEHILYENRSVLEFLSADYTFLNQRLADHYGMDGVQGNDFRKVSLQGTPRGGILTQGGILTFTSHPTRTSPVKRGKFVLEQILGTPPPPAPANVPPFEEKGEDPSLTLRQRFEAHRSNAACASCHSFLDPMGMALENYDAIGRWRELDGQQPVDAGGRLVTGEAFRDFGDLRQLLVQRHGDAFVRNLSQQLLTYALGRGLEYTDKLAVQAIMRRAAENEYRFQEVVFAVCESVPFQRMRSSDAERTIK